MLEGGLGLAIKDNNCILRSELVSVGISMIWIIVFWPELIVSFFVL